MKWKTQKTLSFINNQYLFKNIPIAVLKQIEYIIETGNFNTNHIKQIILIVQITNLMLKSFC